MNVQLEEQPQPAVTPTRVVVIVKQFVGKDRLERNYAQGEEDDDHKLIECVFPIMASAPPLARELGE